MFVLVAVGVAGVAATAVTAWAVTNSPILVDRSNDVIWRSLFVASYVAVGAYTWWRRPQSPLGAIVAGAGFLYAVTSQNASGTPLLYTLGMLVWSVYIVYTGYMYLCFPRGWLVSELNRWFMLVFALSTALLWGLILPLSPELPAGTDFTNCGTACPHNALQVVTGHASIGTALITAFDIVFTIAAFGVAMLVFHNARSSSHLRRRVVTPLTVVVLANIVEFVVSLFLPSAFPGTRETLKITNGVVTVAVPIAIFAGQVRGDMFAAVSLGRIVLEAGGKALTPAAVEKMIGDALGDSTLTLGLWAADRNGYVDSNGALLELQRDTAGRGVTEITRDDRRVAVLTHDPSLDTNSNLVEGLAASSLMLLENARLVEELRSSRNRIVEAAERERRRLERDLHDGAQHRLIAIQVRLRMAQRARGELADELEAISTETELAVEELRALARGIYPGALRTRGLADALRSLAMTAPIPVSVRDEGIGRCPTAVESAIYFCSVEAVQNAIKHAGGHCSVTVTLERDRTAVQFAIADDGVGTGPLPQGDGMGMTNMRDRISAVGGELEVVSSADEGTTVQGKIPLNGQGFNSRVSGVTR